MLRVNEIFSTIQGEATNTGTPAVFVRLQGCDVGCPWCDTKHTWPVGDPKKKTDALTILLKGKPSPKWAEMSDDEIVKEVVHWMHPLCVITGGEPCAQPIGSLCEKLIEHCAVQVETSGTYEIDVPAGVWVTVSPKFEMPGGHAVLRSAIERANEIKVPVKNQDDVLRFYDNMQAIGFDVVQKDWCQRIWLQPVSESKEAIHACVNMCLAVGHRLSIQTHKIVGLR